MGLKCNNYMHFITAFAVILVTILFMSFSLGASKEDNRLFLANTFFSTYYSDVPALTYYPTEDPSTPDQIARTYYGCLFEAQVGVDGAVGCNQDNVRDYRACLVARTTSEDYRKQNLANAVQNVLNAYSGDAWNVSSLPAVLLNPDLKALGQNLVNPQSQVLVTLSKIDSVLAKDVAKAITSALSNVGIPGCLSMVFAERQNFKLIQSIVPTYDELWQCTAGVVYTEAVHRNAFKMCVPQSSWPSLDVMQTPYSSTFLGSYNKYFVHLVGLWIMCSFLVYSTTFLSEETMTDNGKPGSFFGTGGYALTTFCFLWCFGGFVMAVVRSFTSPDSANNFPMSVQTVIVAIFFTVVSTIYFGRELWEMFRYGYPPSEAGPTKNNSRMHPSRYRSLQTFMKPNGSGPLELSNLLVLLLPAWNDCFVLVDGLLFLGVVGSSQDLVSADVVVCFLAITGAALMNSALSRIFVETYNVTDNGNADEKFPLRKMSICFFMAMFALSLKYWYLVFSRYSSAIILTYVIFTSIVPVLIWAVILALVDNVDELGGVVEPHHYLFLYNVAMRAIFVAVILAAIQNDVKATYKDDKSLAALVRLISTE